MAVNYQTEVAIKQQRIPRHGMQVVYSRDPLRKPLGTGGPIKKAEKRLGKTKPFLVLNGDVFADIDYQQIIKLHEEQKATATITLCQVRNPSRYGVAELGKGGRITKFIEKPREDTTKSNLINAGAYVLSPEIFKLIPKDRHLSIEREIFPNLAKQGNLFGYVHNALWMDIGKPEDYLEINKTLIKASQIHQVTTRHGIRIEAPVAIDRNVSIGTQSTIGPYAIIGKNVKIGKKVRIANSVVLRETVISDSASISGAIIGEGVFIGKHSEINSGCIIGDHVRIRDKVSLAQNVTICPAKEISENIPKKKNIL
jgi:mannose-1-phosphate guanylyltransferase